MQHRSERGEASGFEAKSPRGPPGILVGNPGRPAIVADAVRQTRPILLPLRDSIFAGWMGLVPAGMDSTGGQANLGPDSPTGSTATFLRAHSRPSRGWGESGTVFRSRAQEILPGINPWLTHSGSGGTLQWSWRCGALFAKNNIVFPRMALGTAGPWFGTYWL